MNLSDPFLFLVGDRGAIQRIAGSWWSLLVGALFVITAGIARNYDHLSFTQDLEWIYGPFLASILSSLFIFGLGCTRFAFVPGAKLSYLSFLSLYWMTAPCAWLYGIPVERFTDILTATKWNVAFLAIVSLWRVALMIRCLQVLGGESLKKCASRIIFPASLIMMIASFMKGIEIVGIMGGVRLSPHEEFLRDAANFTTVISFWAAVFSVLLITKSLIEKNPTQPNPLPWKTIPAPAKPIALATSLILAGLTVTLPTQSKAQRNSTLNAYINNGEYRHAIDYASSYKRSDFLIDHHFPSGHGHSQTIKLLKHLRPEDPFWLKESWIKELNPDPKKPYTYSWIKESLTDKSDPEHDPYHEEIWNQIKETHGLSDSLDQPENSGHSDNPFGF